VSYADGGVRPIERVRVGDWVLAPDQNDPTGPLKPAQVTQTFSREVDHILNFWGTEVTPGHVFLRGDGPNPGQAQCLIDILLDDGAAIRADGTLVRAATGCALGSEGDRLIPYRWQESPEGPLQEGQVRLGARFPTQDPDDCNTIQAFLQMRGLSVNAEGLIVRPDGPPCVLHGTQPPPRPEAYILARSGKTLAQLMDSPESLDDQRAFLAAPPPAGKMVH